MKETRAYFRAAIDEDAAKVYWKRWLEIIAGLGEGGFERFVKGVKRCREDARREPFFPLPEEIVPYIPSRAGGRTVCRNNACPHCGGTGWKDATPPAGATGKDRKVTRCWEGAA